MKERRDMEDVAEIELQLRMWLERSMTLPVSWSAVDLRLRLGGIVS